MAVKDYISNKFTDFAFWIGGVQKPTHFQDDDTNIPTKKDDDMNTKTKINHSSSKHPIVPEGFRNNKPKSTKRNVPQPTYEIIPGERKDTWLEYTTKEVGRVLSLLAGGSFVFSVSFWIAGGAVVYFLYMIFEYIKTGSLVIVGSHITTFSFRLLGLYLAAIIIHRIGSSYDSFVNEGKRMDNFLWFLLLIFVFMFVFGAGFLSYYLYSPAITGASTVF